MVKRRSGQDTTHARRPAPGARALLLAEAAFFLIHTHLRGAGSRSGSESGVLRAKGEWDMALQPPSSVSEGPGGIETLFLSVDFSALWFVGRYHSDCEWLSRELRHAAGVRIWVHMEGPDS